MSQFYQAWPFVASSLIPGLGVLPTREVTAWSVVELLTEVSPPSLAPATVLAEDEGFPGQIPLALM